MAKFSKTGQEIGASETPWLVKNIYGDNFINLYGKTRNDLLQKHRAALEGLPDDQAPTPAMLGGNYFQDGALQWFNDAFEANVAEPQEGFSNPVCFNVASLDGRFAGNWTHEIIQDVVVPSGSPWELKIPRFPAERVDTHERVIQVHNQMDCTDSEFAVIAELARSDFIWRVKVIKRHEPLVQQIRDSITEFWQKIEDGTDYPPATSSEANNIPSNRKAEPLDLTENEGGHISREGRQVLIDCAETLQAAKRSKKAAEGMIEECGLQIKTVMAGLEKVKLPDFNISFSTVEVKAKPEKITPAKPGFTTRRLNVREI